MKNGVPFDVAYTLEPWELYAYGIKFAQIENGGKEWDWDRMKFMEQPD